MTLSLSSLLLAIATGFLSGLVASIPVGPVNISIINEGARRGFGWAFLIGLGAVTMEAIYCTVAFAGFSGLFANRVVRATMELLSFLLMVFLGGRYLLAKDMPATTKSVQRIEQRLHPHTAFAIGFVRVLGNPVILLFWIALCATFISHEWMDNTWSSKSACIGGMALGAQTWFILLSLLVSRGHGRFSANTLLRMSQLSGVCLLVAGFVIGLRLIRLLARH